MSINVSWLENAGAHPLWVHWWRDNGSPIELHTLFSKVHDLPAFGRWLITETLTKHQSITVCRGLIVKYCTNMNNRQSSVMNLSAIYLDNPTAKNALRAHAACKATVGEYHSEGSVQTTTDKEAATACLDTLCAIERGTECTWVEIFDTLASEVQV